MVKTTSEESQSQPEEEQSSQSGEDRIPEVIAQLNSSGFLQGFHRRTRGLRRRVVSWPTDRASSVRHSFFGRHPVDILSSDESGDEHELSQSRETKIHTKEVVDDMQRPIKTI